jgi:general stress protein 26
MKTELSEFYALVDGLETAMLTTRTRDGHLRSRAMANQKPAAGADLWFVTMENSPKLAEIAGDPHVNLSYYRDSSREWVSVSGTAHISRDRDKIRELHAPDWALWFPKEGDPRHGTPEDPRMVLIGVSVHAAEYLKIDAPRPVVLFEMVKGWLTGTAPEIGTLHHVVEPRRRPA